MFYRLKQAYRLMGWEKLPWALADRNTGRVMFISAREMDALKLCNGKIDTSLPLIPEDIRAMLPEIEKSGIIEACAPGESIEIGRAHV